MSSGKSYLCRQIISHLDEITYCSKKIDATEIVFLTKSEESAKNLKSICDKKNIIFSWWKIIHSLQSLIDRSNDKKHLILIFEDWSGFLNNTEKAFNAELVSFLYRSRHNNISIIYILHNITHALTKRTSFERIFIDNASGLFFFKPINNKKTIYNYLKNYFSKKTTDKLDDIFDLASKFTSYPYLFIQPQKDLKDEISKIRIDIFKLNIFLQSGI